MKKNQNPLQNPALALLTFNRSIKLMALAMIGIFAGVMNSQAQTPAIVGRPVVTRLVVAGHNPIYRADYIAYSGPSKPCTNNGIVTKTIYPDGFDKNTIYYIDLNDLTVNRAMAAAPIGTLKVTPSNNASEQTKVQWSVE
jgi:hypothetical protein